MDESVRKYLVEVLEFYANEENYITQSDGFAAQYDPEPPKVDFDRGKKAKTALKLLSK